MTKDMTRAEKKPAPSIVERLLDLAGKIGGHKVAEEGIDKDGQRLRSLP